MNHMYSLLYLQVKVRCEHTLVISSLRKTDKAEVSDLNNVESFCLTAACQRLLAGRVKGAESRLPDESPETL